LLKNQIPKKEGERGQGVGLMLALMICRAYQGSIVCESTGPEGTTFLIKLPAVESDEIGSEKRV
jgi:signal transduction histidine kinase